MTTTKPYNRPRRQIDKQEVAIRAKLKTSSSHHESPPRHFALGSLESEVLAIVCEHGGGSVGEVRDRLVRPVAYTTVMTTLDRLYKKDLLERQKAGRRFVYAPRSLRQQHPDAVATPRWPVLTLSAFASYLLDAVGGFDETLLKELERNIALRRRQFEQTEES